MTDIFSFKDWLISKGAIVLAPKSEWEILRVETSYGVLVVYQNKHGHENWPRDLIKLRKAFEANQQIASISPEKRSRNSQRHQIEAISQRDGLLCWFCGEEFEDFSSENLTVEHLVPIVHGGPNHISNLVLACKSCNAKVGILSVAEKVKIREAAQ